MRAIERVPRRLFAPHRFRDLSNRNMALPIGCGQTMPAAADLAWRLETLNILPQHRVLEIGSGSGYGTTVLSLLANDVESMERFETLAIAAKARLESLGVANARVSCGDGFSLGRTGGLYDRIVLHVALDALPTVFLALLKPDGVIGFGRRAPSIGGAGSRVRWARIELKPEGERVETDLGPCRLAGAFVGRAKAL